MWHERANICKNVLPLTKMYLPQVAFFSWWFTSQNKCELFIASGHINSVCFIFNVIGYKQALLLLITSEFSVRVFVRVRVFRFAFPALSLVSLSSCTSFSSEYGPKHGWWTILCLWRWFKTFHSSFHITYI